jgi:hypothetical protein
LRTSFGYPKHKQKTLEFAQDFGTQSSFWFKINLDPTIRWRRLDKINVHRIYTLQFFNNHKASCLWFMKHYQTKKIEKIMQCSSIKFPTIWYGNGFFLKEIYIMHSILNKCKKTNFWMEFHPKSYNL